MSDTTAVVAEENPAGVVITELETIDPERVDGVGRPANGTPFLMMKALPEPADEQPVEEPAAKTTEPGMSPEERLRAVELVAKAVVGGVQDERPDIDGGKEAIALIGKLIVAEAEELAAGYFDETCDIRLLVSAVECIKQWLVNEKSALMHLAMEEAAGDDYLKSAAEELEKDTAGKSVLADQEQSVNTGNAGNGENTGGLSKADVEALVEAAVTKATEGAKAELEALRAELVKVKATPIPGGPVMSIAAAPKQQAVDDWAAKAAHYRTMANRVTDPTDADGYRQLAAEADKKAREGAPSDA